MLTEPETEAAARELLCENVEILTIPTDDAWARDVGPTFVTDGKEVRGINWSFNAWGGTYDGLYQDWQRMIRLQKNFVNRLVMTIMMRLLLCWKAVLSMQTDRER